MALVVYYASSLLPNIDSQVHILPRVLLNDFEFHVTLYTLPLAVTYLHLHYGVNYVKCEIINCVRVIDKS